MRRRTEPVVSLELGTSHVRAFVAEPCEHGTLALLGMGECESSGIRKGEAKGKTSYPIPTML